MGTKIHTSAFFRQFFDPRGPILNKKTIFSIFSICCVLFAGCDRELKEHKGHPAVVKKLEKQNDPALQAKAVEGMVSIDPKLQAGFPINATLFIYARPRGVESGPPVAVRKFSFFELPQAFTISPADAVMDSNGFEGELTLSARIDRDGNAKAGAGDITGSADVTAGQKGVVLVLNQVLEETGKKVTGILSLDPALTAKLPPNAVLFLFARPKGMTQGPPLAVKRLMLTSLPLAFTIGQSDTMMPDAEFDGPVTLTARIDTDGNAGAGPGDIEGSLDTAAGAENVKLVLNRVVGG